jgi:hypothetical protein
MSDRYKGLIIVLDRSYKDEDARHIINALSMIKGVQEVTPIVDNPADWITARQIKFELWEKIRKILD